MSLPVKAGGHYQPPLFTKFTEASGWDAKSAKGFLTLRVTPNGENPFWIIQTHTQADYDDDAVSARLAQLAQIGTVATLLKNNYAEPVFVVGDLNTAGDMHEWNTVVQILKLAGLEDSFRSLHPDSNKVPGFTYDGPSNALVPYFAPSDSSLLQRLDYMFAPPGKVRSAEVRYDFKAPLPFANTAIDLSDHYPMVFEIDP